MGRKLILTFLCLIVFTAFGFAQEANVILHVEAVPELAPGFIQVGDNFTLDIYMQNISGSNCLGYSATWELSSPDGLNITYRDIGGNAALGSDGSVLHLNGFGLFQYWTIINSLRLDSWDGSLPDTMNHTAAGNPVNSTWPASDDQDLIRLQIGAVTTETGTLCIDSIAHASPVYNWLWQSPSIPEFNGPYCWIISDGVPPVIGLSLDSLDFDGVTGDPPPSPQSIVVSNPGSGTLNWTADWDAPWLVLAPAFGTSTALPTNVQVSVNTTGMSAGVYIDTVEISDPNATNSPQTFIVSLTLTDPPPTIGLSDDQFFFSGVAGSTNPPNQTLSVTNDGAGTLNWTASNDEAWLTLSAYSGVDDGDITLMVDITGLAYGLYYDTVIVSDPTATNDPQIAAVRLEVASDLPVLAVDRPSMYIIVEVPPASPPNEQFTVFNDGAGSMTFYLEEDSPRILNMTPDAGTVPETIDLEFKILNGNPNEDFFDTIWVYSDEAINSPIPVALQFHLVAEAAEIFTSVDSIYGEYYECSQGTGLFDPPKFFSVFNAGGDVFEWDIIHQPDWLYLSALSGGHGTQVYYSYLYDGYDAGLYEDSIQIFCLNATNSVYSIPVQMRILETDMTPSVYVSETSMHFAVQENKTSRPRILNINNINPGCMTWTFDEDLSWITFDIDSSNGQTYPWLIEIQPNGYGLTLGTYAGTGQINSPDADNVPITINFSIDVWKLHGDCNWDGILNLLDILWMIDWIYFTWPDPMPELIVADVNCDFQFNLLDIQELINYVYFDGTPLCGNPY